MAYQNTPSTRPIDSVRLLVGDISTSTASNLLDDTAYTFFLAQTPGIYPAASLAAQALAALASQGGLIEKSVGDLSLKYDYTEYMEMAKRYDRMAALKTSPYAGGISRDDKKSVIDNTDRVVPAFSRGQFQNPSAVTEHQSTQWSS